MRAFNFSLTIYVLFLSISLVFSPNPSADNEISNSSNSADDHQFDKFMLNGENPSVLSGRNQPLNDYPLSKEQVDNEIDVTSMNDRIADELDRNVFDPGPNRIPQRISEKFARKLDEMVNDKCENSKNALTSLEQSKGLFQNIYEYCTTSNESSEGYFDDFLATIDKRRQTLLIDTLKSAANIKSFSVVNKLFGTADYMDLIEIGLTLSDTEKNSIRSFERSFNMNDFLKQMAEKKEIRKSAALSFLLKNLLTYNRDRSFKLEKAQLKKDVEKMLEFLDADAPKKSFRGIGEILPKRNYVHLRHLFKKLADDESLQEWYQELRKKFTDFSLVDKVLRNPIAKMPKQMTHLYDLFRLLLLITKNNKVNQNEQPLWKLLESIAIDIECGRPYFYAALLHEKLKILTETKWFHDFRDTFSDITRIILARAAVDLREINRAFSKINTFKDQNMTLFEALDVLKENHFSVDSSDGHVTLDAYGDIVEWAILANGGNESELYSL